MKRAALLVLTLAFILPLALFVGEPPATALTCKEQCDAELWQCLQSCQGVPSCRRVCNDDHAYCVGACP